MSTNYTNILYKDYEELSNRFDKLMNKLDNIEKKHKKEIRDITKKFQKEVSSLKKENLILREENQKLKKENTELKAEILRIKSKNNKDSSNSSKPSSTDGFKKVITNRREKSSNKKGGQIGHKGYKIDNKFEKFISSGNIEEEIIEVNKNDSNKHKKYIERKVIDIKIVKTLKIFRYYPDETGKYNIPKVHNQNVLYGNFIKAMSIDLLHNLYNSTDGVTRFIEDITNGGISLSKGTIINWNNEISEKLDPQINNIEKKLLESYYLNHDESQIKINGNGYNILCACNKNYTRLWTSEHKSQEAIDKIGFLPKFHGIIVKDGTELYNKYGLFLAQCLSHIQRYLKGIYENISHKAPKKVAEFLSKYNDKRKTMINNGKNSFSEKELKKIYNQYDVLMNDWEKEIRNDTKNYLFDEELKLWKRMKYDNKIMDSSIRGDREEILYFLKDFKVPATNNPAEVSQRGTKIKQKIGKFRSVEGADTYSIIKSCILTYKKNDINVFNSLISAFSNNLILV